MVWVRQEIVEHPPGVEPVDPDAGKDRHQLRYHAVESLIEQLRQEGGELDRARARPVQNADGRRQSDVRRPPDQETSRASAVERGDGPRDREVGLRQHRTRRRRSSAKVGDQPITNIVAAKLDHVERVGWRDAARLLQERVDLVR